MQDRGERHSLQKTVRRKEEPQGGGASPGIKRIGKASASGKDGVDKVKGSGEFEGARVRPKGKLPALEPPHQQQGEGGGSMEGSPAMRKGQLPPLEQQEQDIAVDEVDVERGDASLGVVATEGGENRTEESVVVVPAAASAAEMAEGGPSGNTEGEAAAPGGNREGEGSGQEGSVAQVRAQESKPAVTPVHKGKRDGEGAVGMNAFASQTASSDPVSTLMVSPYQLRFNRTPATRNLPRPLTERGPLHKPLYAVSPNDGSKSAREHSASNHTPSKKKSRLGKTPVKEVSAHSLGQLSSSSLVSPGGGPSVPVDLLYGPKGPMLTYGVKQRYVERPGARPEGIIQMPFGRYFELQEPVNVHEVWSQESLERLPSKDLVDKELLEDVDYPVGLSNFEEHPGARINSPLSVRALEAAGCLTEDLGKQTLEEMVTQAGGDEEVGALRYEFHVKSRAGLMAILMEHRAKLERSAMGVGPRELGTLTKSGRSRGTGSSSKKEGSVDRGRHSMERVKAMERRRMEILLKSHIAAKDRVKDLQEKLSDKFDAKARLLEEMREELRERNMRKYEQHYEKREELVQKLEEAQEETERAIRAKQQVAEQAAREAQSKVMRRIELKKEMQRLRNMQHEERKIMAARAIETSRRKKQEKAAGVLEAYEVRNQHRESLLEQRRDMYRKFHHDRELFNHVVDEYRERGTFSKLASKVEIISQFLELDPSSVPIDFEDRNPSAYLLHRNQHVYGSVARGVYSYFKFRHSTMDRVSITLKSSLGDPDLYVGNHTCPWPSAEACVWKKEHHGDDRLVLHSFDKHFNVGFMYIGIRGTTDSNFSLLVKWRDEASPGEESLGDDVRQELAKQRQLQVAEEASQDMGGSNQHRDPASLEAKEGGSERGHVEVGEDGEGGAAARKAGDGDDVEEVDEGGVSRSKDEGDTAVAREARGSSKKKHGEHSCHLSPLLPLLFSLFFLERCAVFLCAHIHTSHQHL